METPIVCTLSAPELRWRRDGLLRQVREQVLGLRRLAAAGPAGPAASSGVASVPPAEAALASVAAVAAPGEAGWEGFELRFAAAEATVAAVLELVRLESRCCAFLRFRVTLEPAGGPVLLEIGGPAGGARLLLHEMALDPDRELVSE
jgi:hypothetical protein